MSLLYDLSDSTYDETGAFGEMIVNSIVKLRKYKERKHYLFKDVYIENNGSINQIDHIFVLNTGVFVVETKMINRKIYGKEEDLYWHFNDSLGRHDLYNPILQNEKHVKAVKRLLGNNFPVYSVVVFPKENKPKNMPSNVLNFSEFIDYPLNYQSEMLLSDKDIDYIKHILDNNNQKKEELKSKHKQIIKELRQK